MRGGCSKTKTPMLMGWTFVKRMTLKITTLTKTKSIKDRISCRGFMWKNYSRLRTLRSTMRVSG
jgi:hypothetical protein